MTPPVQTQLTEEQVREWRAILEADDTASLHNEHQRALADAYLAQQRVIEAVRGAFALDDIHEAMETTRAALSVGSPETTRAESVTAPRPDEKRNPDEGSGGHRTGSAGVGSPETRGTDLVLLAANRITHMDYPDDAEERLRRFSEDAELLAATVLAETRETE